MSRNETPLTPLGRTWREVEAFVTEELVRAAPTGWTAALISADGRTTGKSPSLMWRIRRTDQSADHEYNVLMPASLEFVIFTHGNTDAGMGSLEQSMLHARVVEASAVHHYGFAACLKEVMATGKPNQWGLT